MSSRAAPWHNKPSQALQELVEQLTQLPSRNESSSSLYVLQRLGPASFVVGQGPGEDKFKVTLGNQPTCTCWQGATTMAREPCVHLLFIMLRVMRLAADNPLLWQSAVTDRELQELLDGRLASTAGSRSASRHSASKVKSSTGNGQGTGVQRRCVEQDEPCPICYEHLSAVNPAWLVWCSSSCGRNVHGKCMRVWSDHQTITLHQELTCPLCRCPWGPLDWSSSALPAASAKAAVIVTKPCHRGVHCSSCSQSPIEGTRYRCLECASYNLCRACYDEGRHLQHRFVSLSTPAAAEQLAARPMHVILQCSGVAHGGNTSSGSSGIIPAAADSPHSSKETRLNSRDSSRTSCTDIGNTSSYSASTKLRAGNSRASSRGVAGATNTSKQPAPAQLGLHCNSLQVDSGSSITANHGSAGISLGAAHGASKCSPGNRSRQLRRGSTALAGPCPHKDVPPTSTTEGLQLHLNCSGLAHSSAGSDSAQSVLADDEHCTRRAAAGPNSTRQQVFKPTARGSCKSGRSSLGGSSCSSSSGHELSRPHSSDVPCRSLADSHGLHSSSVPHSKQALDTADQLAVCLTAVSSAAATAAARGASTAPTLAAAAESDSIGLTSSRQCCKAGIVATRQHTQKLDSRICHQLPTKQVQATSNAGAAGVQDATVDLQLWAICGKGRALGDL